MRDKSVATAAAAVLAAFAVAHLMQFGLTAGRAFSDDARAVPVGLASYLAAGPQVAARLPSTPAAPADPPGLPVLAQVSGPGAPEPDEAPVAGIAFAGKVDRPGGRCARGLVALPEPGGLLRLRLDAPCDPEVRVEIRHGGLRFALATGPRGIREVVVPAFAVEAEVAARFPDGSSVAARARVPEAAEAEWLAVIWEGGPGIALRADEGAVHRLGDPEAAAPVLAAVHRPEPGRFGPLPGAAPRLVVEVNALTCGRDLVAEVLRAGPHGAQERMPLRIAMPDCDASGEIVELALPLPAVRVARN